MHCIGLSCEEHGADLDNFMGIPMSSPSITPPSASAEAPEQHPLSPTQQCEKDMKAYFRDPTNPHVQRFLELQSDITAHRLAWAYMILWQRRGRGLEDVIKNLVEQRDSDPNLRRIWEEFQRVETMGSSSSISAYRTEYLARSENTGAEVTSNVWQFRNLRREQLKHSLIAASMGSMRNYLINDYNVPQDSPLLIQQADINLAGLLDTVAQRERRLSVVNKMTNLMETVDRSYDMREYNNTSVFRTQWRRADQSRSGRAGYQGTMDEDGLPQDRQGTHHRAQARRIREDMERLNTALASLKDAIIAGISSCSDSTVRSLVGACPQDPPSVFNQKFTDFINSTSLVTNSLNERYQSENPDQNAIDALSKGGKVLESDDFNQRNFCNNPAKYLCDSPEERSADYARSRFDDVIEDSYNEGINDYASENMVCQFGAENKEGQNCTQASDCNCSADQDTFGCWTAGSCTDYADMAKRRGCYDAMITYQQTNIMTDSRRRSIERNFTAAQNDVVQMLGRSPFNTQLPETQRNRIIQVIRDASLNFANRDTYGYRCNWDRSENCDTDADCVNAENPDGQCIAKEFRWNMFARFGDEHTGHSHDPYSTSERPEVWVEGMAFLHRDTARAVLLHELGHLVTSQYNTDNRLSGIDVRGQEPFRDQKQCFLNDELSDGSNPASKKVNEAIADGFTAQIIGRELRNSFPQTSPQTFNIRAIESLRERMAWYCGSYTEYETRAALSSARTANGSQSHPRHEDRINRIIMANTEVQRAVGCQRVQNPVRPPKYETEIKDCMNDP